jgi:hypothetical protein
MVGINEGMISAAEAAFGGVKASYSLHALSSLLTRLNYITVHAGVRTLENTHAPAPCQPIGDGGTQTGREKRVIGKESRKKNGK